MSSREQQAQDTETASGARMSRLKPNHVVVIEDDDVDYSFIELSLMKLFSRPNLTIRRLGTVDEMTDEELRHETALFICDLHLPGSNPLRSFETVKRVAHRAPIVILSGANEDLSLMSVLQSGFEEVSVIEFLSKDELHRLGTTISRALNRWHAMVHASHSVTG